MFVTLARRKNANVVHYAIVGALFLLGLAVRFWHLTYHSLWFDETISVVWASQPAARIWDVGMRLVEDKHPPLYYLLLRGWVSLLGSGDYAVRSLGGLLGAVAVLPVYGIGQLLAGRRVGTLAALLVAINPYLVWYSQEARMFMPSATFGLLGLYGLLHAWGVWSARQESSVARGRWAGLRSAWSGGWLVALIGLACAVYSYLFGVFFLAVAGAWQVTVYALFARPGRQRRTRLPMVWGTVALVAATGLVIPLLWSAWKVSGAESAPGVLFGDFDAVILRLLESYSLHRGPWSDWTVGVVQVGAGLLALIGMLLSLRGRPFEGSLRRAGQLLLAQYLWVPLLLGGLLLAWNSSIFEEPRYFTLVVPALCLLWARGLVAVLDRARWVAWVAIAALVTVMIAGLTHLWMPQNLREDWRTTAEYVAEHADANDAVLVHVDYVRFSFDHYFDGAQPVFFPFTDRLTHLEQVEPALLGLLPYDTVWLVQSHLEEFDPDHLVERWLADRFPLATEQYPSGVTVKRFITRYRLPAVPPDAPILDAPFGPDVVLAACRVDDASTAATDYRSHPPSAWVHVVLFWRAERRPPADYVAVARMVDNAGQVWGEGLSRERDTLLVWPTSRWEAGETVRQEIDVNLNPVTPEGLYRIVIGLGDAEGQPLGPDVVCGQIEVLD